MTKIIEEGEVAESTYVPKTNKEIRKLALDLMGGQVFGSWQLQEYEQNMLASIFMPLMLMSDVQRKQMVADNITHLYGNMSDAAPRSINGLPMFFSMYMLTSDDLKRVYEAVDILKDFMEPDDANP